MGRFRSFWRGGEDLRKEIWDLREKADWQTIRCQTSGVALRTPSFRVERSEIEKSPRITQPGAIVRKGIRHTACLSSIFYLPMSDTPPVWRLFVLKSQTSYLKSVVFTQLKMKSNFLTQNVELKMSQLKEARYNQAFLYVLKCLAFLVVNF